jgi:hypothetical protein
MKNLKHIKLFENFSLLEAFASSSLNKVFNYIKTKESKEKFSNYVRAIAGQIDVPSTAITDKYFEYLPYKDAIKKNISMDLVDCKATSIGAFGNPNNRGGKGVPGDICTGGKLKKAYGSSGRTRDYDCPVCNGTGKVSPAGQLKYLKFWLNSKGEFIGVTAVDGLYHPNKSDVSQFKQIDITDELKAVYNSWFNTTTHNLTADLEAIEKKYELVSGKTKLAIDNITNYRWRDPRGTTIGTYWKDRDGKVYIASGNHILDYKHQRPVGVKWKEFGSYIGQLPYIFGAAPINTQRGSIKVLTDIEERDDVLYNVGVQFTYPKGGGGSFRLESSLNKSFLNDAEFAILFDFQQFESDMASEGTKNLSTIKDERTERKTGVIGGKIGISDKDIKKANIDRYTDAISNVDITQGFDKLVKKLPRFFGGRYILYYMMEEKNFTSYRNTISYLLDFMTSENDESKKNISDKISMRIRDVFESNKDWSAKLENRFKEYVAYLNNKIDVVSDDKKKLYSAQLELLNKMNLISTKIWEKVSKMNVECVEDFEIIYSKISGIYNALMGDRNGLFSNYYSIRYIKQIFGYTDPSRTVSSFLSTFNSYYDYNSEFDENLQKLLGKLDYLMRVIDRM